MNILPSDYTNDYVENLKEQLDKLRKGNEILRKMGEFYANPKSHDKHWDTYGHASFDADDGGVCAIQALKEYAEIMGEE